jgi:ribokinase
MPFGEKIPYESVTVLPGVGNAPNAAVAAARLGLASALVAITGQDDEGEKTLKHFQKESVMTDFITSQEGLPTNYHYVLRYGAERTILIKHEHYNYVFDASKFADYEISWVYLTTIADGIDAYYEDLSNWLDERPEIKLAFQPGTFQIRAGIEKMKRIYTRSNAVFCNKDEARMILNLPHADYPELHAEFRKLGPEIVCITDGPNGATISNSEHGWFVPEYPDPKPPVDRTGAGDACSSTTVIALAHGQDLPTALSWGVTNSMSVVQEIGAQAGLLSQEKIQDWLAKAPIVFQPKQLW